MLARHLRSTKRLNHHEVPLSFFQSFVLVLSKGRQKEIIHTAIAGFDFDGDRHTRHELGFPIIDTKCVGHHRNFDRLDLSQRFISDGIGRDRGDRAINETVACEGKGFEVVPRRWMIERTFGQELGLLARRLNQGMAVIQLGEHEKAAVPVLGQDRQALLIEFLQL